MRVLKLLEAGYLRPRNVVIKLQYYRTTVIKFRVILDENGTGCSGTEVRADTFKLVNVILAGFRKR